MLLPNTFFFRYTYKDNYSQDTCYFSFALVSSTFSYFLVPAKIASFEEEYIATYKEDVKLACKAVGHPKPDVR